MSGDVVVPEVEGLFHAVTVARPLLDECAVDNLDGLDEEGASAGRRIEHSHEAVGTLHALGELSARVALDYVAPSGRVGEAVLETKFTTQLLVNCVHDARHHGSRRIEDATQH